MHLNLSPSFQCAGKRQFIGKFEARASRQTVSDARNFETRPAQAFGQVIAGSVSFDVGTQSDHHLADRLAVQALLQRGDSKVLRLHIIKWGNLSTENVIPAAK